MAAQTNYSYSTPKGIAGGKVDISFDEVITRQNEENDGVLKYGTVVVVGSSAGNTVKLPTTASTANDVEGIVLNSINVEQDMNGKALVKKGTELGIMRKGHIWGRLDSQATATYGATAYVIVDSTAGEIGTFTNTQTESKTIDIGARFGKYADDGIAVIEL